MSIFTRLRHHMGSLNPEKRKTRILPKKVLLLFAFTPLLWGIILSYIILSHETPGFSLEVSQEGFIISKVESDINPVSENDRILAISGQPHHSILGSLFLRRVNQPSSPPALTIVQNNTVSTISYKTGSITILEYFKQAWASILITAFFTFIIVSALLRSPPEQPADLVLLTMTLFSLLILSELPNRFGILDPSLISFSFLSIALIHWLAFSAWTHFVLQFPVERQFLTKRPLAVAAIYLLPPVVALGLAGLISSEADPFWEVLQRTRYWATPLVILGTLFKHMNDFYQLKDPLAKSQLKLLMSGGVTAIAPFFFLYMLPNLIINRPLINFHVVVLFGMLIPLTLLLAITRYRLMDVDQIISKGATYITLIILLTLVYSGVIISFKHWVWGDNPMPRQISIVLILFIALVINPVKNRLQLFIDKFFKKDPVDYEILLHDLSNRIIKAIKFSDLISLVTKDFPKEFRLQKSILMVSDPQKTRAYPERTLTPNQEAETGGFLTALKTRGPYLSIYDEKNPHQGRDASIDFLNALGCPLVFSLKSPNRFFGALVLGEKTNRKPYSSAQIRMLSTLANTLSIGMANALMYESLKESRDQVQQMFNKVVQAEKLAAIGEMTAVLTHEIRNPLAVIRSSAEFLFGKNRNPEIQEELLSNILAEIDTLSIVVNNTLGLARYKPPKFQEVDISGLVQKLVDQWIQSGEHQPGVHIMVEVPESMPAIYGDATQLSQVFINLIKNSEEAMSNGGDIQIKIFDTPGQNSITLEFKDTGTGISKEREKNIFKKFYTSKESGLGLGLAVCDQIINAHNGLVRLKNRKLKGTCVQVCLPYRPYKKMPLPLNLSKAGG